MSFEGNEGEEVNFASESAQNGEETSPAAGGRTQPRRNVQPERETGAGRG